MNANQKMLLTNKEQIIIHRNKFDQNGLHDHRSVARSLNLVRFYQCQI
jgi:hypothetical protein